MSMMGQEKPSLEELAHHGVKGMKWGKRRGLTDVHNEKVTKSIAINNRVASGKGSFGDKFKVAQTTTLVGLAANKGLKGVAAKNERILKEHKARIENGQRKIRDGLAIYGGASVGDLIKASRAAK
jgi:hypothetical protein